MYKHNSHPEHGKDIQTPPPPTQDIPPTQDKQTPPPPTQDMQTPPPSTQNMQTPPPPTQDKCYTHVILCGRGNHWSTALGDYGNGYMYKTSTCNHTSHYTATGTMGPSRSVYVVQTNYGQQECHILPIKPPPPPPHYLDHLIHLGDAATVPTGHEDPQEVEHPPEQGGHL